MREIPVYLFTGFLEAGKTKFIQETLQDERFNSGERTLLLVCEEGIEEYDPEQFSGDNVFYHALEKENLNPSYLADLIRKNKAERVVIEYNGMWQLDILQNGMPRDWVIYQEFMFAEAGTFMAYNANMRQLVVDKLRTCELIVFNRCDDSIDKMELHKIVRGVSRRASIAYEYPDGKVEYDEIEDPLPFDINAPVIEIEDDDYALFYRDIAEEYNKYDGKIVKFKGVVAMGRSLPKETFVIGRHIMTCCVDDIQYSAFVCEWEKANTLQKRDWVNLTAKVEVRYHKIYAEAGPVLVAMEVTTAEKPQEQVATFY